MTACLSSRLQSLHSSIYGILDRACAEKVTYVLRFFDFSFFFRLTFLSFSFLFAAVIDLLLGLLAVKKTSKKASSRRANANLATSSHV